VYSSLKCGPSLFYDHTPLDSLSLHPHRWILDTFYQLCCNPGRNSTPVLRFGRELRLASTDPITSLSTPSHLSPPLIRTPHHNLTELMSSDLSFTEYYQNVYYLVQSTRVYLHNRRAAANLRDWRRWRPQACRFPPALGAFSSN
jgi:hypothetical protein